MTALETLLNAASNPFVRSPGADDTLRALGLRGQELVAMLSARNGFFAFEGALHVFPLGSQRRVIELVRFNDPGDWKATYWHRCEGLYFFASNAFGDLYALQDDTIVRFDPETGAATLLASDLEAWASWVLANYRAEVGWAVARDWQDRHGPLEEGLRLMPVRLFCMGGTADPENLRAVPLEEGLALRGAIATHIRGLPDGARVRIKTV